MSIFEFDIKIDGHAYENTLDSDLRIDRTDLDEEFCTQHEKFAKYATLHEFAKAEEALLKRALGIQYAQLDKTTRVHFEQQKMQNPKFKFTEKMVENTVVTHEDYQTLQLELLNARKLAGILGANREAFAQRKEMLISLGANLRTGATSVRILGERAKDSMRKLGAGPEEVPPETTTVEEPKPKPRRKPKKNKS